MSADDNDVCRALYFKDSIIMNNLDVFQKGKSECEDLIATLKDIGAPLEFFEEASEDLWHLAERDRLFEDCTNIKQEERLDELAAISERLEEACYEYISQTNNIEKWFEIYPDLKNIRPS